MHEHIFIENIIRLIPNTKKVKAVFIGVGDLVGVEPNHLREHLILHAQWEVSLKIIKSSIKCSCGYFGEARIVQRLSDMVVYDCPECSSNDVEVIEGKDIKISRIIYNHD